MQTATKASLAFAFAALVDLTQAPIPLASLGYGYALFVWLENKKQAAVPIAFLVLGLLTNSWLGSHSNLIPASFAGLGIAAQSRTPRMAMILAGTSIAALLLFMIPTGTPGAILTAAAAITFTGAFIALQWNFGGKRIGGGTAALVTGGQVMDGAVTYGSIGDPFGWMDTNLYEQVLLSRVVLEWTGPGYLLLKIIVGVAVAAMLPSIRQHRASIALLVAYFGFMPAIFSLTSLIGQN